MGLLKSLVGLAAPVLGTAFGGPIGGAIGSALGGAIAGSGGGSKQSGTTTSTTQQQLDPRMQSMLFGDNGQQGLLAQYQALGQKPQNAGSAIYGQAQDNYVGKFGAYDMERQRDAADRLMGGNVAAPTMGAAKVNAPGQNGMSLTGSYESLINGPAGENPYLTGAIGKGINQSNNAFGNYLQDAKNATQDMLGNIRGGAQMAGGYGGSRQGLAEGKAIESMNTQLGRAASQFGQNNTDAAVAAQAGAYDSDRNRQLAATQGLSAQQYGVAQQNASMQQQANQANMQSQLSTNQLNQAGTVAGMGGMGGLLGQASAGATNQDNLALNKASQMNGLLAPYLSANSGSTSSQPYYQNTAGNMVSGAAAGLGLYNQFKDSFGSTPPPRNDGMGTGNYTYQPQQLPINTGALTNMNWFNQ